MKERTIRSSAHILTGSYNPEFAANVAAHVGLELEPTKLTCFANTEIKAEVPTVRGDHVFVIQSHGAPVNETFMEHLAIINAARRASAREVTAVVPYRGYGLADRPDNSHESFMGPLTMRMMVEAGASRIIEVDPHAGQSAGFLRDFSTEYTTIPSMPVIEDYIKTMLALGNTGIGNACIVSPDAGRSKLSERYAGNLQLPMANIHKSRPDANTAKVMGVVGYVKGKSCYMIDDMIDTAGTIIEGSKALMENGAEDVTILATHGIFSEPAIERLVKAKAEGIVGRIAVTDTLKLPEGTPEGLVDAISVAPLVGGAIDHVFKDKSVSGSYR